MTKTFFDNLSKKEKKKLSELWLTQFIIYIFLPCVYIIISWYVIETFYSWITEVYIYLKEFVNENITYIKFFLIFYMYLCTSIFIYILFKTKYNKAENDVKLYIYYKDDFFWIFFLYA